MARPVDDYILEILRDTGIALSPRVMAYNLDYTRSYISRRLSELRANGLVERVDEGFYEITELGEDYLEGNLRASDLTDDSDEE